MSSTAVLVVNREEYRCYFETYCGRTFIHLDVFKWNNQVLRRMRADFEVLLELRGDEPIWAFANKPHKMDFKLHAKFVRLMGFEVAEEIICTDGITRPIYIRKRTQQWALEPQSAESGVQSVAH